LTGPDFDPAANVTRILRAVEAGEPQAAAELLPAVYHELRRLAAQKLKRETPGHTLQATALVHEAYVRLVDRREQHWDSRGHFFAAAAEAMRRILVENVRRKRRLRHGGGRDQLPLDDVDVAIEFDEPNLDLLALDEALHAFSREEPKKAELVKLRYFAGLSEPEAADVLKLSRATAARWWAFARAWLFEYMRK
jgi:RNA polymerase sigma factor (TIGR02999 family)